MSRPRPDRIPGLCLRTFNRMVTRTYRMLRIRLCSALKKRSRSPFPYLLALLRSALLHRCGSLATLRPRPSNVHLFILVGGLVISSSGRLLFFLHCGDFGNSGAIHESSNGLPKKDKRQYFPSPTSRCWALLVLLSRSI